MYKIEIAKSFVKDMRKISREVQQVVLQKWIPRIQEDPSLGSNFRGKNLRKFFKFPFRYKKNDYRIVYQVNRGKVLIVFLAIGSRENFYKKFRK